MPAPVFARRRGAAPFSVLRLSGLTRWLDANDQSTLFQDSARTTAVTADADPVGGATDKSLQGHHFTQATAGKRPTYKTNILNGKPSLRFDGVDDYLVSTAAAYPVRTTFIVGTRVGANVSTFALFSYGGSTNRLYDANTQWGYSSNEAAGNVGLGVTPTVSRILTLQFASASACTIRSNGVQVASFDPNDSYSTGTTLELASALGGGLNLNCDIFELIECTTLLSASDTSLAERYLAVKFGITI